MNGRRYQVFIAPSAHRRYKKFDSDLQQKIKREVEKLTKDPHIYRELKGPLKGIRSYHFEHRKTQYRIAYRILERKKEVEIVLVKSREAFYQILRRIVRL
ncbi:MAG TPA: type II toxin-antitoxin system mRNA interferase toxin, RelE/StbE family [Desulfatiglandales bacterium]|nr:type II toxin-antitoxin system mRNA interferase toxin, RelE/StbE family [Desulfatiglandales bacterium]